MFVHLQIDDFLATGSVGGGAGTGDGGGGGGTGGGTGGGGGAGASQKVDADRAMAANFLD